MIVLITGASGGFGAVLGATLVDAGMTVYGTMRHPEGRESKDPFPMLPMEVTDAGSVEKCVNEVLQREGRIHVVVNCVNQMVIGSVDQPAGSAYFLLTGHVDDVESPAGTAGDGTEIDRSQSVCR